MSLPKLWSLRRPLLKAGVLLVLLMTSVALVSFLRNTRSWGTDGGTIIGISHSATKKDLFHYLITKEERERFRSNLAAFVNVVPRNVTYFIEGGTLLGAYRHGGMIPWDDDLDLLVKDSDRALLRSSLISLAPEYELNTRDNLSWKFSHSASKVNPEKFKWPFLDIFFYLDNATHLWISQKAFKHTVFEKELIFPLRTTTFMKLQVPAPNNITAMLSMLFDMDECVTNTYNHRLEKCRDKKLVVKLPCQSLYNKFTFSSSYLNRTRPGPK